MTDLIIRAPEPDDAAALTALYNMPGVRHGTLRIPFTTVEFARRRIAERGPNAHLLVAEEEGRLVAQGGLIRMSGRQSHVADLFVAVADDRAGQGIGAAMMAALLDLADNWLGLVRVELGVNIDNTPAIRLYERFGFEREGLSRASILRDGMLVDSYMMARLRDAPSRREKGADPLS